MPELILTLILDTIASWIRIFVALALSIIVAWIVGIAAARNRSAERLLVPIFDILQAVPVLGFLPIILIVFVTYLPPSLGVEFAVIFLIFSGLGWSMAFAVYEAVRSIPKDLLELAEMEKMTRWKRITNLYIPASWSKVAYNSSVFWSAAVFYLASSEIFCLSSINCNNVSGIGADLASLSQPSLSQAVQWGDYTVALLTLIAAIALTRFLFLGEFALWSEKFKLAEEPHPIRNDPIYRFYSWVDREFRSRIPVQVRGSILRLPRITGSAKSSARFLRIGKSIIIIIGAALLAIIAFDIVSYLLFSGVSLDLKVLATDEWTVLVALLYSFLRVWGVYAISVIIGFPTGIVIALNTKLFKTASPILQIVSAIPAPAFLPALAIYLTTIPFRGELTAEFVIFLGMIWYIIFNVMQGVRSIPNEIWEVATLTKMKRTSLWKNIVIPAALPSFITGSITAVGGGWSVLVVAEFFQSSDGSTIITQVSTGVGKLLAVAGGAAGGKPDFLLMSLALVSMTAVIALIDRLVWKRLYNIATQRFSYNR